MCLGHQSGHAICVKATSKVTGYLNNPEKMAGAKFYSAGSIACFRQDTVVQLDNGFPIPHTLIETQRLAGKSGIEGYLPGDPKADLLGAVDKSTTLTNERKRSLRDLINSC